MQSDIHRCNSSRNNYQYIKSCLLSKYYIEPSISIPMQDTIEDKIQKFLYTGDDRNIARVYVAGHRILDLHNRNIH